MNHMKCLFAAVVVCLVAAPIFAQDASAVRALSSISKHPLIPIGTAAPDFSLKGTDEKIHTLAEFSSAKVLVIIFEICSLSGVREL